MSAGNLEANLRLLLRTAGGLGHDAARLGISRTQAVRDIADGPESAQLLAVIIPKIRAMVRDEDDS